MLIKNVSFNELYYGFNEKTLSKVVPKIDNYKPKTKWLLVAKHWYWYGLNKDWKLIPKSGVSKEAAMKHIQALLNTWYLSKDEKVAHGAKLLSLWFDNFEGKIHN